MVSIFHFSFCQRTRAYALTQPRSTLKKFPLYHLEIERWNPTKHLPYLFPDYYMRLISHLPFPGVFFSFTFSLQSCQYQVPPWLSSLPLVSLSPPGPKSSVPAQALQPGCLWVYYAFHSLVCDGSVVRAWLSGTLWHQALDVNWAICKILMGFIFPVAIMFLECF